MQKHLITIACVFVLLFQGGFDDSIWSLAGMAAAAFLILKAKKRPLAPIVLLLLSMALVYCVAMFYHGLTFEALAAVNRVVVAFLILMVFYNMEADVDNTIIITGMVAAGIGLAAFSGIFHWDGAVSARRLQSTFQYANTAGLFFAVAAFIAYRHDKKRPYAFVFETAMLLTQSVGAIAVYIIGWVVFAVIKRSKVSCFICSFMLALVSAALVFGAVYVIQIPPLGILPPLIVFVVWKKYPQLFAAVAQKKFILWIGAGLLPAVGAVLIMTRGLRPIATYIERIIQSMDGINIMRRYPFGLGPGGWPFYFTQYQSAPYDVSIIHNGYVGMGVDAGFLVIIPVLVLLVYWFKHQKWGRSSVCVVMILLQAFMDIPFSFLIIVIVLAMLAAKGVPETWPMPAYMRLAFIVPVALCALVFSTAVISNRAAWLANNGQFEAAVHMLDNRLIHRDTDAILTQMQLFLLLGDHANVEQAYLSLPRRNARAYFIRAASYLDNEAPYEAMALAMSGITLAPHSSQGFLLAARIMPYLSADMQLVYHNKMEVYAEDTYVNPLFIYITRILEGG